MRENFDYVKFDTYSHDMAELSDRAAEIIKGLRKQTDEAKRLIAMLIIAGGGKINVPVEWSYDPTRDFTTEITINPVTREYVYQAKWNVRATNHVKK